MEHPISKRIWHIIQAVYYILRKGLSKKKLMMDLQLLLKRAKLSGKSLSHLLTSHPHGHVSSIYSHMIMAKDVEFSCSNTPANSYPSFHLPKRRKRNRNHDVFSEFDVATVAKAFEILNYETNDVDVAAALATPSPMLALGFGKSSVDVRQLRVTDSPFPVQVGGQTDGFVDKQADDFIKRFYEQLKLQRSLTATPTDYNIRTRHGHRGSPS